jgi:hypothetical protein
MRRNSRSSFVVWFTFSVASVVAAFALPRPLSASLGDDVASVQRDQEKLQASLQRTSKDRYEVHEMHAPNNLVVREFVSPAGKVFGVAWQGPTRPDMQQLLGAYFDQFTQAAEAQKVQRKSHGPLSINESGLVVQMSGHGRWFVGRAYVPQMVPAGMKAEEVR